jgi:iron(III) transport system substrate-binding protein
MKLGRIFLPGSLALSLLAAACGGTAPSSAPPASAQSGTAASSAAKPANASAATSGAAAANGVSTLTGDALYQAAKKEGEVVVNNQDPGREQAAVDAFSKRYPGIKVTWQVGRGSDVSKKLITQAQGNVYTHDVFASGPHDAAAMRDAGRIVPYQSPELANMRPEFIDPDKVMMPLYLLIYGITVNTKLVPPDQEPKSYQDLLDPKWKGQKIAMQDPRGSGGTMTLLIGVDKDKNLGEDYIRKLAAQDIFTGRETQQILTDLIRGEYSIMIAASAGNLLTEKEKNPSVPIKEIKPTDGMTFTLNWQGIVKNAPHPNAAKLWADWRLTQEGQELLANEGQGPVRNGVKTSHDETNVDGLKIQYLDVGQDTPNLNKYTKLWDDIFFKK